MKKILNLVLIAAVLLSVTSCTKLYEMNQPKEKEVEYSAVWPLAGEWWVVYRFDNGSGVLDDYYGVGHTQLLTYNTAAEDNNKLWISDAGNFWTYTTKANCNVDAATFSGTDVQNTADNGGALYDIKMTITDGKVIKDGGKSASGVVCDSIYFKIEYADDPGTIYHCSGVRRTGFLEDEY